MQSEIGTEVDDGAALADEIRDELRGGPMGERQEDRVGFGDRRIDRQLGDGEMRSNGADRLVVAVAADEADEAHIRVAGEDPNGFAARIARGPDDRDRDRRVGAGARDRLVRSGRCR